MENFVSSQSLFHLHQLPRIVVGQKSRHARFYFHEIAEALSPIQKKKCIYSFVFRVQYDVAVL